MSEPRTIWQIGGGPDSRVFADVFLKNGVALIGPGWIGPWTPQRVAQDNDEKSVARMAFEVKSGHVFVLRHGQSRISAVGVVDGEYQFFNQFDDVNGWDLQHGRRVRWCSLPEPHDFGAAVFGANPRRIARVAKAEVRDYVERFLDSPPTHWQTAPLPPLPVEEPRLSLDDLPVCLKDIVAAVNDLGRFYWDRKGFGGHPTEDELLVHFVVPLLRALGWAPERIGIKWHYIDITLFKDLPRTPQNCHLVIEAKRLGAGVEGALGQGKRYLAELGIARDIVVTDGIRYRLYDGQNSFQAAAYANLANLKPSALRLFDRLRRP